MNGSGHGIVIIQLEPATRGHSMGFPIHPRTIMVSLEDPDGFLAAAGATRAAPWGWSG